MDLAWLSALLAAHGIETTAEELNRAEAAARPDTSAHVADSTGQSGPSAFAYYLSRIVDQLPVAAGVSAECRQNCVAAVTAAVKTPGGDHKLWSIVLPGVPEALAILKQAGLRLVVVSNSDGSVERALEGLGLAARIDLILDSQVVGFEKPDPRFFRYALERSGATAETTVHVGDMYFQDVVGARSAGIRPVLLDPYGDWVDRDCERSPDLASFANGLAASLGDVR